MATKPPSDSQQQVRLYTRNSSGLVRDISLSSAIALNVAFLAPATAVLVVTQEPVAFPGGNPFWTALIAGIACLFPVLVYAWFTIAMPRSGGDYVFVSRSLHPWAGFGANFNIVACPYLLGGLAVLAYFVPTFGLSSAFATIGATTENETLLRWSADVTESGWAFGIGTGVLVLAFLGACLRVRYVMHIVKGLFALTILGLVISVILLLVNSRGDFQDIVASLGGDYDGVIAAAREAGYPGSDHFDLGQTLLALPLLTYVFVFAILTSYVGGELRSAKRNALPGMLGSLGLVLVLLLLLFGLAGRTFGFDFLGSATFLGNGGSSDYPFAGPPFFFYFVSTLTGSTFLVVVISIAFVAAILAPIPGVFLAIGRSFFAWAFDRIAPRALSSVNPRTHSPVIANLVVCVLAVAYLAFYAFGPSFVLATYYSFAVGAFLTFAIVGLAAIVFPYRRRQLYEDSPINRSVAGLPALAWAGVGTLVISLYSMIVLLTNDTLGANQSEGLITLGIIWALAIVIWPISYAINRRRGVNLLLSDRQLPPE